MIISNLDHLEVVVESSELAGGNSAYATAYADSLARGYTYYWPWYGASASTFTDTDTYTDYSTAAASSFSNSSASTY
jgi:hypothetical protein